MTKSDFPPKTVVLKKTGELGIVCRDESLVAKSLVHVVFEGENFASLVPWKDLDIIGKESAKINPKKCGIGMGKECCIFVTMNCKDEEFECERFGNLRATLIAKKATMIAQREPIAFYPYCQLN